MVKPNPHGPFHGFPFGAPMPPSQNKPMHPFHSQQHQPRPPHFLDQFKKPDGAWDYDKMMNHGGQVINIVKQARPLVKQMGPLFSLFKR